MLRVLLQCFRVRTSPTDTFIPTILDHRQDIDFWIHVGDYLVKYHVV
jgi:hypothetical protein